MLLVPGRCFLAGYFVVNVKSEFWRRGSCKERRTRYECYRCVGHRLVMMEIILRILAPRGRNNFVGGAVNNFVKSRARRHKKGIGRKIQQPKGRDRPWYRPKRRVTAYLLLSPPSRFKTPFELCHLLATRGLPNRIVPIGMYICSGREAAVVWSIALSFGAGRTDEMNRVFVKLDGESVQKRERSIAVMFLHACQGDNRRSDDREKNVNSVEVPGQYTNTHFKDQFFAWITLHTEIWWSLWGDREYDSALSIQPIAL